jgi:ATP-binding cassette, subfamily B, bacterial
VNAPGQGAQGRHQGGPSPLRSAGAGLALVLRAAPLRTASYLLLTIAIAGVPIGVAWLTKLLLDEVVTGGPDDTRLIQLVAALVSVTAAGAVLPYASQYIHSGLQRAVGAQALDRLYVAVGRHVGLRRLEDPQYLDRLEMAKQGASHPTQLLDSSLQMLRAALTGFGLVGSLILLSPAMAIVVGISAIPALIVELWLSRQRADMLWHLSPTQRRELFYRQLLSDLQAAKEIRLFGLGSLLRRRMLAHRRTADTARAALDQRNAIGQGGLALLSALIAGAGLAWAVREAHQGRLSTGDIAMFVAAVGGVQGSFATLIDNIAGTHQALVAFDHYLHVTRDEPDLPVVPDPAPVPVLRRGIEFHDVWFRYGDDLPWVLRGINLLIPGGAAVGLVGLNGAGKSTLVKLLCRFYDPSRGSITWDGVDLRRFDPQALRQRLTAVFQDYMAYELTAAENIGLGDTGRMADRPALQAAALQADVHEVVSRLPNGYDTPLTRIFVRDGADPDEDTGVVLSGGQWQRIAIARALLREQADLVILDEPSAGLDAAAEHGIHTRMREFRCGRTSLLISHRLGSLRDADMIVVLDSGVIVEQGSHAELMAEAGPYSRLFTLQARDYRPEDRLVPREERLASSVISTPVRQRAGLHNR